MLFSILTKVEVDSMARLRPALIILPMIIVAMTAGSAVAAPTGVVSIASMSCTVHGYAHTHCKSIKPHQKKHLDVPGLPASAISVVFANHRNSTVDAALTMVSNPAGAPAGSSCFTVSLYNHASGQPIDGMLQHPFTFKTSGRVFSYDPAQASFTRVADGTSGYPVGYSGGLYCVSFFAHNPPTGSTGPVSVLPQTGGAAKP